MWKTEFPRFCHPLARTTRPTAYRHSLTAAGPLRPCCHHSPTIRQFRQFTNSALIVRVVGWAAVHPSICMTVVALPALCRSRRSSPALSAAAMRTPASTEKPPPWLLEAARSAIPLVPLASMWRRATKARRMRLRRVELCDTAACKASRHRVPGCGGRLGRQTVRRWQTEARSRSVRPPCGTTGCVRGGGKGGPYMGLCQFG